MTEVRPPLPLRVVRSLWRAVDGARRFTVNLIFILLLALLLAILLDRGPRVPDKAALVIAPVGALVEQRSGDAADRALRELTGDGVRETLVRDVVAGIRAGKDDPRIAALLLDLDELSGGGMSTLRSVKAALAEFRASGKKVIAAADVYGQAGYYLAAQADEIHLAPLGLVLIQGFGIYRPYYKEGLDKFEIEAHVFRVGEFKSAVEPYLRDDLSPEARESYLDILGDLWGAYLEDVAAATQDDPGGAHRADRPPRRAAARGGRRRRPRAARGRDWSTACRTATRCARGWSSWSGRRRRNTRFHQVSLADYLEAQDLAEPEQPKGDAVGVVVARGTILDGEQPAGKIGGDTTSALVRQARENEKVKAIVLRVDSGGGSAFASELIRRELALARAAGKPVVVSMGSVAASGGYWISTASDQIWADPTTITGSIGIFGVLPTFQKPLAKYLGVHVDGVGTTWLAGAYRPDRALDPRFAGVMQNLIDRGYEDFLARVGEARKMSRDEVDRIGRGRIWSGADAQRLGLVDHLGGLEPAIAAAGELAKLGKAPKVLWIEKERTWRQKLAQQMLESAVAIAPPRATLPASPLSASARLRAVVAELESMAELDDPRGVLAHCLCGIQE